MPTLFRELRAELEDYFLRIKVSVMGDCGGRLFVEVKVTFPPLPRPLLFFASDHGAEPAA